MRSGCASTFYCTVKHVFNQSGCSLVVMVEPSHDRNSRHLGSCRLRGTRRSTRFRNLLLKTLMGSCPVEIDHIPIEHAAHAASRQGSRGGEAHSCRTLLKQRSQIALARASMIRYSENLNRARCRHTSETRPKFVLVITDQKSRCLPIRGGFAQLLRDPGIARRARHAHVDHPS